MAGADPIHDEMLSHHDKVLIVDFGSQVTQLIARRVREAGVYCEIAPFQSAERAFASLKPKAVILSGGPCSVTDEGSPRAPQAIFDAKIPVLGICYGEQVMATQLGGKVEAGHHREFGRAELEVTEKSALFDGVWEPGKRYPVWMSHGDRVTQLPQGFKRIRHYGLLGPARLPDAVVDRLSREFRAVLTRPDIVDKLGQQGFLAHASTPAELGSATRDQFELYRKLIQEHGIKAD